MSINGEEKKMEVEDNMDEVEVENRQPKSKVDRFCRKVFPVGFKGEFFEVFKLAWPAFLTSLFQFTPQTVSVIMCGHLAKAELDAAGLANSMINVFGISVGIGLSTACDTFFSQTYGSENKKRVGVYLQRSVLIMNSVAVVICCVHMNIEPILVAMGQNIEISRLTARYMLHFLPGVFFDYNFIVFTRYLQNQNILIPSLVAAFAGNTVNIISQYVFIHVLGYSYLASAVCQAITLFIMFSSTLGYILVSKVYKETWGGFSFKEALVGWGMFFSLGIPGIFMVGLEEWSFEIATFVAGTIDITQLGIQLVVFQMEVMSFMIPLGISIAVNIRVGQHLGGQRPQHAKTAYRVGLALTGISATVLAIILLSLRNYIPYIFTNDKEIVAGASVVLTVVAGFHFFDGVAATSAGALRGCGRQFLGAVILFVGYYVLSLPIGISMAIVGKMNVLGLWLGLLMGICLEAVIFVIILNCNNWEYEVERAAKVAYGGMNGAPDNEDQAAAIELTETTPAGDSEAATKKTEPFLEKKKKSRPRRIRSYLRRAVVSLQEVEVPDVDVNSESFRRIVIKRIIFIVVIALILTTAITCRVFQPSRCYPVTNSSMEHYQSILPLCNETAT